TSRTVTSTQSDLYSAVVAGLCALKGPLHGGAADDALRLFQEIGRVEAVPGFAEAALASKRKVAGLGHRVYRTGDPRARPLEQQANNRLIRPRANYVGPVGIAFVPLQERV